MSEQYEINGCKINIRSEAVAYNQMYFVQLKGDEYKIYAESLYDKEKTPEHRHGWVVYLSDIQSQSDKKIDLKKHDLEIIRAAIAKFSAYNPNIFFKFE
jgi:hypothetical protein